MKRETHNSEIERIFWDYCGEWINRYDRRSYCLRAVMWTCYSPSNYWKIHQRYTRQEHYVEKWVFPRMEERAIAHIDQQWQEHQWQVGKMVYGWSYLESLSTHVPEAMQKQHRETERRQFRETESKIFLSGSSGSAGETTLKPHPPHIPSETLAQTWRETQVIHSFFEGSQLWFLQTNKHQKSSMQKESWKSTRQDTASYNIWRCKVLNEVNESRLHHRCAVFVKDLATARMHKIRQKVCSDSHLHKSSHEWFTLIILQGTQKLAKIFRGITTHLLLPRSEINASVEGAVRRVKEGTSTLLV